MAEVKPLKLIDQGGGNGALAEFESGDLLDPEILQTSLKALAALVGAANRVPYFTGAGAMALAVLTAQARTFLAAVDAAGQRSTLNCASKSGDVYTGQHDYGNTGSLRFTGTSSVGAIAAAASAGGLRFSVVGNEPAPLFIDFDATVPDAASALSVRFFRGLNTSGACSFVFHKGNGTTDTQHTLDGKGAVRLNRIDGETVIGSATSNNVDRLQVAGSIIATGAIKLASFTLATLPAAAANARGQVYCSNLAGQAAPVYSDGTNWRRVSDNTIAN
jgi:hypothetical protein